METTAKRIKQALYERGMKQTDLVEKTGIGKSSISTYLSGAYLPKQKNIYKIAKALDVDEAWLMGGDVPMERCHNPDGKFLDLTPTEHEVVVNYRSADEIDKEMVNRILKIN